MSSLTATPPTVNSATLAVRKCVSVCLRIRSTGKDWETLQIIAVTRTVETSICVISTSTVESIYKIWSSRNSFRCFHPFLVAYLYSKVCCQATADSAIIKLWDNNLWDNHCVIPRTNLDWPYRVARYSHVPYRFSSWHGIISRQIKKKRVWVLKISWTKRFINIKKMMLIQRQSHVDTETLTSWTTIIIMLQYSWLDFSYYKAILILCLSACVYCICNE